MAKATQPVKTVACPKCKRKQPARTPDAIYWCDDCRCQFDNDPDEGGSVFSDPSRRAELEDEAQSKRHAISRARRTGINGRY